ncbi:oxygenase MpaB family protein [Gordonia sp. MP11Mi]|uniref:ER-bound oxygenase mpaB/mpaB'/Rubber oxygenase catalytic domain-containing protein n=1 Tax=Gordonia sp. MP11Mi TaxID=3022769 RepID=A0AA97GW09_9ACTN
MFIDGRELIDNDVLDDAAGVKVRAPRRYYADPAGAFAAAAPMRLLVGPAPEPTLAEIDDIGSGLNRRDELGATLAAAVRSGRVSLKDFRSALDMGIGSVSDPAPELASFFETMEATPDWVDWDLVERGARACRSYGQNALDVLAYASLLGGYRFQAANNVLTASGGLTAAGALRRVGETTKWWVECVQQGGMARNADGFKLTAHVRLMHQLVSLHFEEDPEWNHDDLGVPINAADTAATLSLFSTTFLIRIRQLGIYIPRSDSDAVMHLWRYIGWLLGVEDQWLPADEKSGYRTIYHLILGQAPATDHCVALAKALVKTVPANLEYRRARGLRRRFQSFRALSLGTYFNGWRPMIALGLLPVPPVLEVSRVPLNFILHNIVMNLPVAGKAVRNRAEQRLWKGLDLHFGMADRSLGDLDSAKRGTHKLKL